MPKSESEQGQYLPMLSMRDELLQRMTHPYTFKVVVEDGEVDFKGDAKLGQHMKTGEAYMTDGVLLRETLKDANLYNYSSRSNPRVHVGLIGTSSESDLVTLELPKCKEKGSKKKRFPFFIFVIVIVPRLLIILCCVYLLWKKKHNSQPSQSSGNERFLKVSYNQLLKATDGFSRENLIGEGGFTLVLHLQNRGAHKSFLAECEAWRNIHTVICNDFKALVYEYMPNGSVHDWLHSSANTYKLNLLQRINILRDVATALDYLHNRCQTTIIHGDLKPSNILLDDDMVAHVGDCFSSATWCRHIPKQLNRLKNKYGIGSEMTSSGDVYSFGILLLEVITGKKPTDDMFNEGLSLHKFAYMALPDHVINVIDNDAIVLQSTEANAKKVEECLIASIKIGVSCSLDSPPQRMKIEIVVIELQRILDGDSSDMAKISRKVPTSNLVRKVQERQSMSKLRQCLGNILMLRSLQSEVDFKGDAKFSQDMKACAALWFVCAGNIPARIPNSLYV
ncbi:kinase-like domain-containing protein [Tanacetum coccineum]